MLFIGDLSLMSNYPNHMQTMLNKLKAHTQRKSLTVNTQKSEVMCFNFHINNLPPLFYDGALPYTDPFKYLGMVCDRHVNLNTAADAALRPFTTQHLMREHNLTNRLHVYMWLLKTYAIPAGMYASQAWATPFYPI